MPGLVSGIHVFAATKRRKTWMAGVKPGHDELWRWLPDKVAASRLG